VQSDGNFVTHDQRVTLGQVRRRTRLVRLCAQHTTTKRRQLHGSSLPTITRFYYRTQRTARGSVFGAVCDFFLV